MPSHASLIMNHECPACIDTSTSFLKMPTVILTGPQQVQARKFHFDLQPRMWIPTLALGVLICLSLTLSSLGSDSEVSSGERLRWYREARYGLFLHWGVYSELADEWKGERCTRAEQIQWEKRIPIREYMEVAARFNPTRFNADTWVNHAKKAGMKYIVITSKHHDGFAMFDSPSHSYNIVKATPFARDPMKELAEACRKGGIKLCFYYSLGREWHDPAVPAPRNTKRGNYWDFPEETGKDFNLYVERKVKPQIRELLTQYGPVAMIWFDTPETITSKQSADLAELIHKLQPDCLYNTRIGNRLGDIEIAEQFIPAFKKNSKPWEACLTLNRHWGYDKFDHEWKTPDQVLRRLIDIASKGGNLLLNVGPTGEGVFPDASMACLENVGDWLSVNGEAIYGTERTCFGAEFSGEGMDNHSGVNADGQEVVPGAKTSSSKAAKEATGWRCTTKPGVIYIHLLDEPGPVIKLPKIAGNITKVSALSGSMKLTYSQKDDGVEITGAVKPDKSLPRVIRIETKS